MQSIASGELDLHLPAIARAIERAGICCTPWSDRRRSPSSWPVVVRINHNARPRYLQGLCATIVDVDAVTATISLERPGGRFTTGRLRCPPLALDRVSAPSN